MRAREVKMLGLDRSPQAGGDNDRRGDVSLASTNGHAREKKEDT